MPITSIYVWTNGSSEGTELRWAEKVSSSSLFEKFKSLVRTKLVEAADAVIARLDPKRPKVSDLVFQRDHAQLVALDWHNAAGKQGDNIRAWWNSHAIYRKLLDTMMEELTDYRVENGWNRKEAKKKVREHYERVEKKLREGVDWYKPLL